MKLGDYLAAIDTLNSAIKISKSINDKVGLIYSYSQIAKLYGVLGRNEEAERVYSEGLAIVSYDSLLRLTQQKSNNFRVRFKSDGNELLVYSIILYLNYSRFLATEQRYDSAEVYMKKLITLSRYSEGSRAKYLLGHIATGEYEKMQKHYAAAVEYFSKAYEVADEWQTAGRENSLALVNYQIAESYFLWEKPLRAMEVLRKIDYTDLLAPDELKYWLLKADVYIHLKNFQEALRILDKVHAGKEKLSNSQLVNVYKVYYDLYKSVNDKLKALEYAKIIWTLRDSIYTAGNVQALTSQLYLVQYNKKKREEKSLNNLNEITRKNLKVETGVQFIFGVLMSLMLIAIILFVRNGRKRKKQLTDIKVLNRQLKSSHVALTESNTDKDIFFSIISGKLCAPIGNLTTSLTYFEKNHREMMPEERKKYLNMLRDLSGNSYLMLQDLLTWSRLQMGKISFDPMNVSLDLIMQNVVNMETDFAMSKQVSLENKIPEGVEVYADAGMIFNVFQCIVHNGIKYSENGGKVEIGMTPPTRNGYKSVYVKDGGVGMSIEKMESIFRPESKLATSPGSEGEKGTGLGLLLTKEFIDKNNGEITVKSEIGVGSEFEIFLPEAHPEVSIEDPEEAGR